MIRRLAKLHAYAFYLLRTTFKTVFDDGWEDWKALVVLTVGMQFAIIAVAMTASIGLKHLILPAAKEPFMMLFASGSGGLVIANYYSLIAGRKWARFEKEFRHYTRKTRVWSAIGLWLVLIMFVAAAYGAGSVAFELPHQ